MPFDPISWMLTFALGRGASSVLERLKGTQLPKNLRRTVQDWAKSNQPPVKATVLETIFSPEVDETHPERSAARRRLSQTIQAKRVPSLDEVRDALLEPWDEAQAADDLEHLEDFFHLSREDALSQLSELAERLRTVLVQDESLFKGTSVELLEGVVDQVADIHSITKDIGRGIRQPAEVQWPVFTVPHPRHNCFKGRGDILAELRRSLVEGKKSALTQVISGLGGIGKTQTAVEYAYEHRDEYKAVLWINAGTNTAPHARSAGMHATPKALHNRA